VNYWLGSKRLKLLQTNGKKNMRKKEKHIWRADLMALLGVASGLAGGLITMC
jgi:hypothetical protein